MTRRRFSMCLFYDKDLNIAVQKRGLATVGGEKYAFWGGAIEEGETPEEAVKRELFEELSLKEVSLKYWDEILFTSQDTTKNYSGTYEFYIFTSPISEDLLKTEISEGESLILIPIDEVIRGDGFTKGMTEFVKKLKPDLQKDARSE